MLLFKVTLHMSQGGNLFWVEIISKFVSSYQLHIFPKRELKWKIYNKNKSRLKEVKTYWQMTARAVNILFNDQNQVSIPILWLNSYLTFIFLQISTLALEIPEAFLWESSYLNWDRSPKHLRKGKPKVQAYPIVFSKFLNLSFKVQA